jgi:hypothetical protein
MLLVAFLGPKFLSLEFWLYSVLLLLPLTWIGVAWLQLKLRFVQTDDEKLRKGRRVNSAAGVTLVSFVVLCWTF